MPLSRAREGCHLRLHSLVAFFQFPPPAAEPFFPGPDSHFLFYSPDRAPGYASSSSSFFDFLSWHWSILKHIGEKSFCCFLLTFFPSSCHGWLQKFICCHVSLISPAEAVLVDIE